MGTRVDRKLIRIRVVKSHGYAYIREADRVVSYWNDIAWRLCFPENGGGGQGQNHKIDNLSWGIYQSSPQPPSGGRLCRDIAISATPSGTSRIVLGWTQPQSEKGS